MKWKRKREREKTSPLLSFFSVFGARNGFPLVFTRKPAQWTKSTESSSSAERTESSGAGIVKICVWLSDCGALLLWLTDMRLRAEALIWGLVWLCVIRCHSGLTQLCDNGKVTFISGKMINIQCQVIAYFSSDSVWVPFWGCLLSHVISSHCFGFFCLFLDYKEEPIPDSILPLV